MILLITSKEDITTDFIVKKLTEDKINFHRLNTEDIIYNYCIEFNFDQNVFNLYDKILQENINLNDIKSVYFRRPKLPDLKNEQFSIGEKKFFLNEVNYFFEGLYSLLENAYWISPVYSIRRAENKTLQLLLAKKIGLQTPHSIISNDLDKLSSFIENQNNDCIIKPIKTGFIEEENSSKVIFTSEINQDKIKKHKDAFLFPTYLQNKIIKKADIRSTVVGDKIFSTAIYSQENTDTIIDWRKSSSSQIRHEKINLPKEIEDKCILLTKSLNLKFGAIDLVWRTDETFTFLEINPNGQWAWIEKRLNYNISSEIVNLLVHRDG